MIAKVKYSPFSDVRPGETGKVLWEDLHKGILCIRFSPVHPAGRHNREHLFRYDEVELCLKSSTANSSQDSRG